jgi:hypothetical protein
MNNFSSNLSFNNNIINSDLNLVNHQLENFNLMVNHNMDEFRMYFDNFLIEVFFNERAERFLNYIDRRFHITPFMIGCFLGIFINITMISLIYFHFDNLRNENRNLDLFK